MNNTINEQPLETEELVNNFKYKYEELKYIFDLKIKEMQIAEKNSQEILKKFQIKLDELQNVNMQLKNLVVAKENENQRLHQAILNSREKSQNFDSENLENIIQEKENLIEDLNSKLKNFEHAKNNSTSKNFSTEEFLKEEFKSTKEELEKLKEKFVKKYNYLKEKYYVIKHQNKEKEGIIRNLNSVIESSNYEKEKHFSSTSKELLKMEEYYKSILYKKDKQIEHLLKYKNLINEEFKVIKQIFTFNLKSQNLRLNDDLVNIKSPQMKTSRMNEVKLDLKENDDQNNQKLRESVIRINEEMKRKSKSKIIYKNDLNFKNGELFQRMSYLMNISSVLYNKNQNLSRVYAHMIKDIGKRNALRIDSRIKKMICEKCDNLLFMDRKSELTLSNESGKETIVLSCSQCENKSKIILFEKKEI